jgi:hypothetical protein
VAAKVATFGFLNTARAADKSLKTPEGVRLKQASAETLAQTGGVVQTVAGFEVGTVSMGMVEIGLASCIETAGIGCGMALIGGVGLVWSVDQANSGIQTTLTKQPQRTYGGQFIEENLNYSPFAAELLYGVGPSIPALANNAGTMFAGFAEQTILRTSPINGATRSVPLGFQNEVQFSAAVNELQDALRASGINDAVVGVRGSSVTGQSIIKGTSFGPLSDIDFYVESGQLTQGYKTSTNIPGFVNPNKILPDYPLLDEWSRKWSNTLGRDVTPGGFVPGKVPNEPAIKTE